MRQILDITLNDLRILFRDRGIFIELLLIPIALTFAIGVARGGGESAPSVPDLIVDVLDNDGSELSSQFLADLRAANTNLVLCPMDNTDADVCEFRDAALTPELASERLESQTALALIEIPSGFESTLNAGEDIQIIYRSNESATAPSYILQAVRAVTQRLAGAFVAAQVGAEIVRDTAPHLADDETLQAALYERASHLWQQNLISVNYVEARQPDTEPSNPGGGFAQSVPGMGTMSVMFAVLPLTAAMFTERKNWTLQRLVTMPLSRAQILGGKLIARFVFGMIEYAVIFAFGLLLGVQFGSDPLALLLVMAAYTLCVTALALVLTTFVRSAAQAAGIGLFITLTLVPLGGAWWPLEIVPEWMQRIGHISPVAWAMDAYHSLLFYGGSLSTVIVPLAVLFIASLALFAIGIARFQYE